MSKGGQINPLSHEFFVKMFVIALPQMPVKWSTNSDCHLVIF